MSEHGVSMETFYNLLGRTPASLIIMEDENHHKFGAMVHCDYERSNNFYGSSETFVFTFKAGDQVKFWEATGANDMF